MSKATPLINSFSAGELSPKVDARVDVEKYYSGCRTLENMIPLVEGGATRMPGTYYVTTTKSNGIARLIPFQFSTVQSYVLEFGNLYIRFYKDEGQILSGVNPYEITTPYLEADLFELKFFQSADIMWITHPSYPPKELSRTGHTSWTLTNFVTKLQDPFTITGIAGDPCVVTVTYTDTAWAGATPYSAGDIRTNTNDHYYCTIDHTSGATFATDLAKGYWRLMDLPEAGDIVYLSGIVGTVGLNDAFYTVANPTDGVDVGTFELSGINTSDYAAYVSDGETQKSLYGTDDNNPACGTFFEQRLGLGGSNNNPQRFDLSAPADYDKFTLGDEDDDAIQFTIVSAKVDRILWMVGQDYLILGTTGGIWKTGATSSIDPITQINIDTKKIINIGTKNISPEIITESLLWVSRAGTTVRKLRYSLEEDRILAVDMTRIAKHIAMGSTRALSGIKQMAFQKETLPINWAIRKDGQLLGLTYETQENVFAWFRIVTDGNFESVAVIGDEDEEEQIWVVVNRTIGGSTKRYVEYFKPVEFFSEIKDCFFVHSGLTWDGGDAENIEGITNANPAVVTIPGHSRTNGDLIRIKDVEGMTEVNQGLTRVYTVANAGANTFELSGITSVGWGTYTSGGTTQEVKKTIDGLDHLEGKTVDILIDGAVAPQEIVSGGEITIDWYGNLIHIGLPHTSVIEPMKLHAGAQLGTARGKLQKVTKLIVAFHETIGCKAGPDQDNLYAIPFGTGRQPALFTGDKEFEFPGNWEREATISIVQKQPLPMMIMAIVPEVVLSER